MKMKIFKCLILVLFIMPINIKAIDIYSNNGILYNLNDDSIIFEKNALEKVQIASLTKIMTAVVALENISDLDSYVMVKSSAFTNLDGYATAGFKIGDNITYRDLLYGLLLPSGAECANELAIDVAGDIDTFVALMNLKASELNLENTHFSNPIGMDDANNYSTVADIASILKYALKNEVFYQIFTSKEYMTTNHLYLESTIKEKGDKYSLDVSNILGSKTGFTDESGYCLASIASIDGVDYMFVTTRANTNMQYQVIDAINIYNYYSTNYSYKKILSYNQNLKTINIKNSLQKEYVIYSDIDKYLYLSNDIDVNNLVYEYDGIEVLDKKNINDCIGKINVKYNDEVLYTFDVYVNQEIYYYNYCLLIVFPIIIVLFIVYKKYKVNL